MDRSERDVAKDAEPAASVALGVVAGWPDQRVGVIHLAIEDCIDRGDAAADREQRDLIRAGTKRRQVARIAALL